MKIINYLNLRSAHMSPPPRSRQAVQQTKTAGDILIDFNYSWDQEDAGSIAKNNVLKKRWKEQFSNLDQEQVNRIKKYISQYNYMTDERVDKLIELINS